MFSKDKVYVIMLLLIKDSVTKTQRRFQLLSVNKSTLKVFCSLKIEGAAIRYKKYNFVSYCYLSTYQVLVF